VKSLPTLLFTAFLGLYLLPLSTQAETQYIRDEIRIEMHSGPTTGYRIIRYLKSGDAMSVKKRSEDGKWLNVDAKGTAGWIQTKYATQSPIAKALLKQSLQEKVKLSEENSSLAARLTETQAELKSIKTLQSSLDASNSKLKSKLDSIEKTASNAINTSRSYQLLQEQTELLNVKLEQLEEENKILASDNLEDGIIWGIIAMIVGAILTLTIPKMSTQKRRSEW